MKDVPAWARILTDYGMAVLLVVLGAVFAFRAGMLWLKRKEHELNNRICLGAVCPYRLAAGETVVKPDDLACHPLWLFIETNLLTTLKSLPIKEPGRKLVAQDFLAIKFLAVRDALRVVVKRDDLEDLSGTELGSVVVMALNKAIIAYEDESERLGIPPLFLHRFRTMHSPEVIRLQEYCEFFATSDWFENNLQKLAVILSEVQSVLRRTLLDCERTLGTINGQLNGYVYRGVTIKSIPGATHSGYTTGSHPKLGSEATCG